MHEQPPQRRAALARRTHGREGDGADREIEIGRGRDDSSVVAAELKDRTGEAGGETWADVATHCGRTRSRYHRYSGVGDESLANIAAADHHPGEAVGRVAKSPHRALDECLCGQRRERSLLGWLPHHRVAADESESRNPEPHRDGEVESRDDATDAKRMPSHHQPVDGAL